MSDDTTAGDAGQTQDQSEGVAGVGMLLAAYRDENAADQILDNMKQAKKSGEFYFDDAAVIRKDTSGKAHIKETGDMTTGKGAGIGALIGGVVGLLGGPAGVALGATAGAAIGGIAAHGDAGFSNKSLEEIGGALLPGTSAVLAVTSQKFVEAVRKQVEDADTLAAASDFASDIRANLQAGQDVLYGIVITEDGIAATQIVANDEEVAVFGIVSTDDGVVTGAAVSTPDGAAYKVVAADADSAVGEAGVATEDGAVVVDAAVTADDTAADDGGDADADKAS